MTTLNDTNRKSHTLQLDSRYADISASEVDQTYYIDPPIRCQPWESLMIALGEFQMPNSMYIINSNNYVLEFDFEGYGTITLESPYQNYSAYDLATWITNQLVTYEASIGTVVCTFTLNTLKFLFSSTTTNFKLTSNTTMLKPLGLQTSDLDGSYALNFTPSRTCDLSGLYNIYMKITNLDVGNYVSNKAISNSIAQIPVDAIQGDVIFFQPPDPIYFKLGVSSINRLHIILVDGTGAEIEPNGGHYTCKFIIHYQNRKEEKIDPSYLLAYENEDIKSSETVADKQKKEEQKQT